MFAEPAISRYGCRRCLRGLQRWLVLRRGQPESNNEAADSFDHSLDRLALRHIVDGGFQSFIDVIGEASGSFSDGAQRWDQDRRFHGLRPGT